MYQHGLHRSIFSNTFVPELECRTTSGSKCIFPFLYGEVTYHKCTSVDYSGTFWCATGVDSYGKVAWDYGSCGSECFQGI